MSLTDPNTVLHGKTVMLFAALYYLDIIHPLLDASGRAAAQMTNSDSHNEEDNTPELWKNNTSNNEEQNISMSHLKPEKLHIPFVSTL